MYIRGISRRSIWVRNKNYIELLPSKWDGSLWLPFTHKTQRTLTNSASLQLITIQLNKKTPETKGLKKNPHKAFYILSLVMNVNS